MSAAALLYLHLFDFVLKLLQGSSTSASYILHNIYLDSNTLVRLLLVQVLFE